MRTLLAILLFLVVLTEDARASCVAMVQRCPCVFAEAVLEAEVTAIDGARTRVRVNAVHGETGHTPGVELELPREPEDRVGGGTLVTVTQSGFARRFAVAADGNVVCTEAEPDFRSRPADLIPMMLAEDCLTRVWEAGFREPPCNDTGYACTNAPAGLVALAGLAAALRAARRRSSSL